MAFSHGIDADFWIDVSGSLADMTAYLENLSPEFTRELAEIKALGTTYVQRLAGIRMFSMSGDGKFDPTLDAAIYAAWNGDSAVTWQYYPQGKSNGNIYYYGECRVERYSPGPASSGDGVGFSFTLVNDGAVTRTTYTA